MIDFQALMMNTIINITTNFTKTPYFNNNNKFNNNNI